MAQLGRGQPVPPVIQRGSLADAPVLTTPAPLVIPPAATPRFGSPNPLAVARNSLADAPVLTTAAPVIPLGAAERRLLAATAGRGFPVPPVILRGSLADAPVMVTAPPLVVARPVRWLPTFPVISSAPFAVPSTPGVLTAQDASLAVITAAAASQAVLTAGTQSAGGPS